MGREELNFILELVDGTVLITAFSAGVFLLGYIFDNYRDSGRPLLEYLRDASVGVRMAMPMFLVKAGAAMLVGGLLSSRFRGQNMTNPELLIVIFGIFILIFALVWMTRVLTQRLYGEWPWVTTTFMTIAYIAIMTLWHFWFR